MKISSSSNGSTTATTSEQDISASDAPSQGVFDQLMQLLFASMALPTHEQASVEGAATPSLSEMGEINETIQTAITPDMSANLLASSLAVTASLSPAASTATPNSTSAAAALPAAEINSADINQLMAQLTEGNDNQAIEMSLPSAASSPAKAELNQLINKTSSPENKPLEKVMEQDASRPVEANLLQQQAMTNDNNSSNEQNDNNQTKYNINPDLQPKVELTPHVKIEEKAKTLDQLAKLATQALKPGQDTKHMEKPTQSTTEQVSDLSVNSPAPLPFSQPLAMPIEQHSRIMDAFANVGMLINQRTASLAAEGNPAHTAAMTTPFNPQYDLQLETLPATFNFQLSDKYDARIKIHPPELGNVLAKLKMGKDGAELVLVTENNHVRQIVEANLSQLKQHFQQADIQLTQVEVQMSEAEGKKQQNSQQNREYFYNESSSNDQNLGIALPKEAKVNKDAIVDTYA